MRFPAKVFNNPMQLQHNYKMLDKLGALLVTKYGTEGFYFGDRDSLSKSVAYKSTGRYNYSVYYASQVTGDEVCLMFPIKTWTAEFFMCLEDKIIKTLDFCIEQTKEEE